MEPVDSTKRKLDVENEEEDNESDDFLNNSEIVTSKKFNSEKSSLPRSNSDLTSNAKSKEEYLNKIRKVIETHFDEEINYKQYELEKINDRIFEAQNCLDKLRVCIICRYYSLDGRLNVNDYINHPAIANLKVEELDLAIEQAKLMEMAKQQSSLLSSLNEPQTLKAEEITDTSAISEFSKIKLFVGNVSKSLIENINSSKNSQLKQKSSQINSINEDESINSSIKSSQYNQDLITHKWMVYIRSPNCNRLESYIKKVVFFLHFSYKPYDVVEIKSPPFQLVKKGWGEFPIHVQIHFKDPRNKRVDIYHQIKLDWTQTGLQTFGGETTKDVELIIKKNDLIQLEESITTQSETKKNSSTANCEKESNLIEQSNRNDIFEPENSNKDIITNMDEQSSDNTTVNNDNNQNEVTIQHSYSIDDSSSNSSSQFSSYSSFNKLSSNKKHVNSSDFLTSNVSPSNFISTDIDYLNSPTQVKANRKRLDTNSFDELMLNFCSNENDNKESQKKEIAQIITEPNKNKNDEKKQESFNKKQNKPTLDELLNIRPIQIQSNKILNTTIPKSNPSNASNSSPISLIKSLKPVTNNVNSSSKIQNQTLMLGVNPILNTNLNSQADIPKSINPSLATASALVKNSNMKTNIVIKNPNPKVTASTSSSNNKTSNQIVSNNLNKKMVIYKVDSSDLKKDSSILIQSHSQQVKLILPQQNESISKLNQTSMNNLSYSNDNFENQSNLNRNINIINSLSLNKNSKTDPNNIKNQTMQSISFSILDAKIEQSKLNKSITENEKNLKMNQQSNLPSETEKIGSIDENINSNNNQNTNFVYTLDTLHDLIQRQNETNKLNDNHNEFEIFLKKALNFYPIILNSSRLNKQSLPFSAKSIHEFYSWPYAKRKASEWIRAVNVKNKCKQLIELSCNPNDVNIQIWPTKSIVIWLRSHGYTPLEYKHMLLDNSKKDFTYVNSLSSLYDIELINDKILNNYEEDDELIDIVSVANDLNKNKKKNLMITNDLNEEKSNENEKNYLEMCEGSKHIRELLELLDIKSRTVNLAPSFEVLNEKNKYSCNLVEKMFFKIYKRFAEDLIRETCANIYFDSSKNDKQKPVNFKKQTKNESSKKSEQSQSLSQSDGLDYQKFPQYLSVTDLYSTIKKLSKYDFLTNKYMAKLDH